MNELDRFEQGATGPRVSDDDLRLAATRYIEDAKKQPQFKDVTDDEWASMHQKVLDDLTKKYGQSTGEKAWQMAKTGVGAAIKALDYGRGQAVTQVGKVLGLSEPTDQAAANAGSGVHVRDLIRRAGGDADYRARLSPDEKGVAPVTMAGGPAADVAGVVGDIALDPLAYPGTLAKGVAKGTELSLAALKRLEPLLSGAPELAPLISKLGSGAQKVVSAAATPLKNTGTSAGLSWYRKAFSDYDRLIASKKNPPMALSEWLIRHGMPSMSEGDLHQVAQDIANRIKAGRSAAFDAMAADGTGLIDMQKATAEGREFLRALESTRPDLAPKFGPTIQSIEKPGVTVVKDAPEGSPGWLAGKIQKMLGTGKEANVTVNVAHDPSLAQLGAAIEAESNPIAKLRRELGIYEDVRNPMTGESAPRMGPIHPEEASNIATGYDRKITDENPGAFSVGGRMDEYQQGLNATARGIKGHILTRADEVDPSGMLRKIIEGTTEDLRPFLSTERKMIQARGVPEFELLDKGDVLSGMAGAGGFMLGHTLPEKLAFSFLPYAGKKAVQAATTMRARTALGKGLFEAAQLPYLDALARQQFYSSDLNPYRYNQSEWMKVEPNKGDLK